MRIAQLYNPNDNELILWNTIKRITGGLPDQSTHAGEFLTTDGTTASWIPGGSGTQTLNQTLVLGNTTGGENISISKGDKIFLDNKSELRAGTYDFGGTGGISRICSVGYEDMWQSGIHHIFDNNGFIRESNNCFNINPDNTFDNTLRFKVGSRWVLDDGTTYMCTDASTGAAVWVPINGVIALTYSEATALINNITIGQKYLIIDATANSIPLSVIGTSTTTYSVNADDAAFPTDVVEYDFAGDVISYRWDVVNDISSYEDWRNGTPACIISTTGTSSIHLGSGATGNIPDNSTNIETDDAAIFTISGATTVIHNFHMESGCTIDDGGFSVSFNRIFMQNTSSLTAKDAACVSIGKLSLGAGTQLSTAHSVSNYTAGASNDISLTDNTLISRRFTTGNLNTIVAGSINNFHCSNNLSINTAGNLSDYISLTAQTASIAATDIAGTETAGLYLINFYLQVTTADAGAVGTVKVNFFSNDGGGSVVASNTAIPLATLGQANSFVLVGNDVAGHLFKTDGSFPIQYSTSIGIIGTATYSLDITVEKIK